MEVNLEQFTLIIQLCKLDSEPVRTIFKDTKSQINPQISFPVWGEIYRRIREEDYPNLVPPSDPNRRNVDDIVFINIRRFFLHIVVARTPIITCSKTVTMGNYPHKCWYYNYH
jgi:hypothetical protein